MSFVLTLCKGVRSPHAVLLWPADGHAGRSAGRQRASMATPDRTWGCWWSQSALSPSGMRCLLAAWYRRSHKQVQSGFSVKDNNISTLPNQMRGHLKILQIQMNMKVDYVLKYTKCNSFKSSCSVNTTFKYTTRVSLVFWYMCEWNDDVLVYEDEQSQEKTQTHSTERVHPCQLVKWREVEDRATVDTEHWN